MSWLAAQPMWALLIATVGGLSLVALAGRAAAKALLGDARGSASAVATPLMPALGTAFAVLAAFAVANAASGLRDANVDVGREANAAARMAWGSTAVVDSSTIQAPLAAYLAATLEGEWRDIDRISAGDGPAFDELQSLQRAVRLAAASDAVGVPQRAELLGAVDELSAARRSRFAEATPIAAGVVYLLLFSAVALVLNATVVAIERDRRAASVLVGLVLVTGMSIASVITLGAPFSGSFGASDRPITEVLEDVQAGRFTIEP